MSKTIAERMETLDGVERSLRDSLFFWLRQRSKAANKCQLTQANERIASIRTSITQAKHHRRCLADMAATEATRRR